MAKYKISQFVAGGGCFALLVKAILIAARQHMLSTEKSLELFCFLMVIIPIFDGLFVVFNKFFALKRIANKFYNVSTFVRNDFT